MRTFTYQRENIIVVRGGGPHSDEMVTKLTALGGDGLLLCSDLLGPTPISSIQNNTEYYTGIFAKEVAA